MRSAYGDADRDPDPDADTDPNADPLRRRQPTMLCGRSVQLEQPGVRPEHDDGLRF